jgi:hypothetical protein
MALLILVAFVIGAHAEMLNGEDSPSIVSYHQMFLERTANVRALDPSFDCAWKQAACMPSTFLILALTHKDDFAQKIQPHRSAQSFQEVFDALQLSACNATFTASSFSNGRIPTFATPKNANQVFVDFANGLDTNPGTIVSPLKTIAAAVAKSAPLADPIIELRGGTHQISATISLTAANSGLTIQNYNGEDAIVRYAIILLLQRACVHSASHLILKWRSSS